MAGAALKFEGGYLGIERCEDPGDGKQYLRVVIHSSSTGRTTSAPIEVGEVERFGLDVMKQCAFARGYTQDDLINMGLEKILDEIMAEKPGYAKHNG